MKIIMFKGIKVWELVQMALYTRAYRYLQSGTKEEFAIKKVNYCYLCNGHEHKEPFNLTLFLQNGLLFLNFYFEQSFLFYYNIVPVTHLNFSYFHLYLVLL